MYFHVPYVNIFHFSSAMERFIQKFTEHVNIKKDDGFTPLHLSALNDHLDVLTALLESVSLFSRGTCRYAF